MRTLIANGTLVGPAGIQAADLLIDGERIAEVGPGLAAHAGAVDARFDARGRYVLPGGVDPHVHLALDTGAARSSDDFETGTRAAAFGGTTTVIDFACPPPSPGGGGLREALEARLREAEGHAAIDFGLHMVVRAVGPTLGEEMATLARDEGVSSFKLFTAYPGAYQLDDGALLRVLQLCRASGALAMVHAENGSAIELLVAQALARGERAPRFHAATRPAALEAEATGRCLALAALAQAPIYIAHLTAREALAALVAARARGQRAWAETCPQYLLLRRADLERPGFEGAKFVCSPPLREDEDAEALWAGLASGDLAAVATDHCPFDFRGQKDLGRESFARIPNGLPGIETRLMLLWDEGVRAGRIDVARFVELTSAAPARLFGLWPRKGVLQPGSDADVVVWDPEAERSLDADALHMRVDYSPYEGRRVRGAPELVFSRGRLIVRGQEWLGRAGTGAFLKRAGPG